jgi:hypothetical protein
VHLARWVDSPTQVLEFLVAEFPEDGVAPERMAHDKASLKAAWAYLRTPSGCGET